MHRRNSVSLLSLSNSEIAKRAKLGLITADDDSSDDEDSPSSNRFPNRPSSRRYQSSVLKVLMGPGAGRLGIRVIFYLSVPPLNITSLSAPQLWNGWAQIIYTGEQFCALIAAC